MPATPSSCLDVEQLLAGYILGTLPEADARRVGNHLGVCPRCQGDLASYRATAAQLTAELKHQDRPDGGTEGERLSRLARRIAASVAGRQDVKAQARGERLAPVRWTGPAAVVAGFWLVVAGRAVLPASPATEWMVAGWLLGTCLVVGVLSYILRSEMA